MRPTSVVLVVLGVGLVAADFAACAQGSSLSGGTGGSVGTGSATTGPGTGMVGSMCRSQSDCTQGTCTPLGGASYCTIPCPPPCPSATYCSIVGGKSVCVPYLDQECDKCTTASDCKLPSDACLTAPLGDTFCAQDCTIENNSCPEGYECVPGAVYEAGDAGPGGSGTSSSGAGGAGTGGTGTGGTGTGGSATASSSSSSSSGTPTMPTSWCVPSGGASCPCSAKRDGVTNTCSNTGDAGTCTGTETCNGAEGAWQGCNAPTPPGPLASCTCPVNPNEPDAVCAMATSAGMISDTGGPVTFGGTLGTADDVNVWSLAAVDVDQTTTNSFHVSVAFTAPSPNSEFVMDVERGDPCTDVPSGATTNITSYDWCVNGTGGPTVGEGSCGPMAAVHCNDYSGDYYVRVHRVPGATATCTPYQITATAAGGACDFTMMCEMP